MALLLDDAGRTPADDVLDRMQLARGIFELVRTAPEDWTLRIGVYGRWGEGKSTVLNLVDGLARAHGMGVAQFNPSLASGSQAQLTNEFLLAVGGALDLSGSAVFATLRAFASTNADSLLKAGKEARSENAQTAVNLLELATAPLQRMLSITQGELAKLIRSSGKRLVVFIDDIDRLEPSLVPKFLLALRQLDVPMTSFLVAVDPEVVTKGLAQVHGGWRDASEFLEKILQFHYWLPPPDEPALRRLVRAQTTNARLNTPVDVLDGLVEDVPTNPRRLKDFFRSLWQLAPIVERHREQDVDWTLLILIELMKVEAPLLIEQLMRSDTFLANVAASMFFSKTSEEKYGRKLASEIDSELEQVLGNETLAPERRARIDRLVKRIGELPLTTPERIGYWARVKHKPPVVTMREASSLLDEWLPAPSVVNTRRLMNQHAASVDASMASFAPELFSQLIRLRQEHLAAASNSDTTTELHDATAKAASILNLLFVLTRDLHVISDPRFGFTHRQVLELYNHLHGWAHFTNTEEYPRARSDETTLLDLVARESSAFAKELLDGLQVWDRHSTVGTTAESQSLRAAFAGNLLPIVVVDVQGRFERREGIASMTARDGWDVRQWLLRVPDAGLYTEPFLTRIESLSVRAESETWLQENFLVALRFVGYHLKESGGAASPEAIARAQTLARVFGILWKGATASPLQPRVLGSLEELRTTIQALGVEVVLPFPDWWQH